MNGGFPGRDQHPMGPQRRRQRQRDNRGRLTNRHGMKRGLYFLQMGYRELDGQGVGVLAILERLRVPLEDTSPPVLRWRGWRTGRREGDLVRVMKVGEVRVPVEEGGEEGVGGELVVDGGVGLLCWCLWTPEGAADF